MGMVNCSVCGRPTQSRSAYVCDECHSVICPDCYQSTGGRCLNCQQDTE